MDLAMYRLILHSDDKAVVGRAVELDPSGPALTIGRAAPSTIIIEGSAVSRCSSRRAITCFSRPAPSG